MKVTLNFEDLAQNMRQLNEFLDKKRAVSGVWWTRQYGWNRRKWRV